MEILTGIDLMRGILDGQEILARVDRMGMLGGWASGAWSGAWRSFGLHSWQSKYFMPAA